MPDVLQDVLLLVSVAATVGAMGGLLGAYWSMKRYWRGYVQHFAAGLLIAIIALDVLPEALGDGEPLLLFIAFTVGGAAMTLLDKGAAMVEARGDQANVGLMAAAGLDTLVNGLIVGAGFAVGEELGLVLTVAMGLDLFALLLAVSAELKSETTSKRKAAFISAGIALLLVIGAVVGVLVLAGFSDRALANVLAFSAAALLYLATEQLLLKAHQETGTSSRAVMSFFIGFLAMLAFTLLGPG